MAREISLSLPNMANVPYRGLIFVSHDRLKLPGARPLHD